MTQETPAKVFSLLGVALTSMFFLFAVSVTNANFSQTEKAFPTAFNPDVVVASLDSVANGFSKFVQANLVQPGIQSYVIGQDNINYIIDEAAPDILAYTGLTQLAEVSTQTQEVYVPQVAGASTQIVESKYYPAQGDMGLFSLLIGN